MGDYPSILSTGAAASSAARIVSFRNVRIMSDVEF
jgi:hypothetical protein